MQFIRSNDVRPSSAAVIHNGKVLETVLVGMTPGESKPVAGGAGAEMREIFRQLDEILAEAGLERTPWGQKTEAAPKLFAILVLIAPLQEILGRRRLVLATDAGRHQRTHATGACRSRAKALRQGKRYAASR